MLQFFVSTGILMIFVDSLRGYWMQETGMRYGPRFFQDASDDGQLGHKKEQTSFCSFIMLDQLPAKQDMSKIKDCLYFPELDLVDRFVLDAVHL